MRTIESILSRFETISLEEMDRVQLMNRTDTKYAASKQELLSILEMISQDYKVLDIFGNRISSYRTLYYDTPELKFYLDHHNGRLDRYKVRFRKYVESNLHFLEVKHKYKGRTNKQRISRSDFEENMTPESKDFLGSVGIEMELGPTLWNEFSRITLVCNTSQERMTIDIGLKFEWNGWHYLEENLVIVEVKQSQVDRNSPFMVVAKKHGIRPIRMSKYCIGMIRKDQDIKYNRFKSKLLTIDKLANGVSGS